jgi:hypothetical protein
MVEVAECMFSAQLVGVHQGNNWIPCLLPSTQQSGGEIVPYMVAGLYPSHSRIGSNQNLGSLGLQCGVAEPMVSARLVKGLRGMLVNTCILVSSPRDLTSPFISPFLS